MSKHDVIQQLLNDENLPDVASTSGAEKTLPKIELRPSAEALQSTSRRGSHSTLTQADSSDNSASESPKTGIERREFTRVDILDRQLELKFANDLQFAKQYIENISLGGLFVKTSKKYEMGALVPIEFSVPRKTDDGSHPRAFQLQGRVCRVAPDGIGLEFTDLSNEIRLELEEFVRSVLPKGSNLHAKAKASTIDRIEKIREKRELRRLHYRRLAVNTSIIATLLIVNFLTFSALERASDSPAIPSTVHRIKLGAKEVEKSAVRSIARNSDGSYVIYIESGEPITISKDEAEKNLPYELRFDTRILSSLSLAKSKRSSHTSQTTRLER